MLNSVVWFNVSFSLCVCNKNLKKLNNLVKPHERFPFWHLFFGNDIFEICTLFSDTGSPHFTRFHITRFTLYTRLRFLPNEFTLCVSLHVFLTLHCQKYYLSSTKLLCFTLHKFQFTRFIQKNKNRVK